MDNPEKELTELKAKSEDIKARIRASTLGGDDYRAWSNVDELLMEQVKVQWRLMELQGKGKA